MSGQGFAVVTALALAFIAIVGGRTFVPATAKQESKAPALVAPAGPDRAETVGNGYASFTIDRAADNHFYAEAQVNGANVRFLIDTGSSTVALTRADALRAGIGASDFAADGVGAGGRVKLMRTTINRIALGPLDASNVPAVVAKEGLPVSLLGQSYLSRIGTVSIRGDTMTLR